MGEETEGRILERLRNMQDQLTDLVRTLVLVPTTTVINANWLARWHNWDFCKSLCELRDLTRRMLLNG
jgi:hypothetical protein